MFATNMQESYHIKNENSPLRQFEFGNGLNCGSRNPGSIPVEANVPRVGTAMARRLMMS